MISRVTGWPPYSTLTGMGWRISFGIGPLRYSTPLTSNRRRTRPQPVPVYTPPPPPPLFQTSQQGVLAARPANWQQDRDWWLDRLQEFHHHGLVTDEEYWTIQRRIIAATPE
jgi:hypothetical protein